MHPGAPGRHRPAYAVALVAITALAAALRLAGLGRESLWVDEGYTKYLAGLTPAEYLDDVRHTVRNILPPLYFTLLHGWTALAGTSETALRLPSAVAGVLCVPLLAVILRRFFDDATALLGAGMLALSLFQLRFGQEARMYELLALLSLVATHQLVRLLDTARTRHAAGLAVAGAAVVWTHHYGALVLVALAAWVGVLGLARALDAATVRRWLGAQVATAVLVLPWALLFLDQLPKVTAYPWLPPVTARTVLATFAEFAGSPASLAAVAALVGVTAWAFRDVPRRIVRGRLARADRGVLLLGCLLVVPAGLATAWSLAVSPVFGGKYLVVPSIALLALAAVGARVLGGRAAARRSVLRRAVPAVVVLVALGLSAPQYTRFWTTATKEQWREATALVEREAAPGDVVLFNAGYTMRNGFGAYATRGDLVTHPFPLGSEEFALQPTAAQLAGIPALVTGRRHAFVVYSQSNDPDVSIAVRLAGLSRGGECTDLVGITVCRYDLRGTGTQT